MRYDPYTEECLRGGWEELSQEDNPNANSRLFRKGDIVRKLYTADAADNIAVLKTLCRRTDLDTVPELVLPTKILTCDGETIGFEMPQIEGTPLDIALPEMTFPEKMRTFARIADLIGRLPPDLVWGDVHGRNIICTDDGIKVVDPDGLGLSCPQQYRADRYPSKYTGPDGTFRISRDSDILGLCDIALESLLDGCSFYTFPEHWQTAFIRYLESNGAGALAETVRSTVENGPCRIAEGAFEGQWTEKEISYDRFLAESGLDKEEQASELMLDRMIQEKDT